MLVQLESGAAAYHNNETHLFLCSPWIIGVEYHFSGHLFSLMYLA